MAYVVDARDVGLVNQGAGVPLPKHQTGDLLLISARSTTSTTITFNGAGWATLTNIDNTSQIRSVVYWKWAASSAEPEPVMTTIAGTPILSVVSIREAYYTVGGLEWLASEHNETPAFASPLQMATMTFVHADSMALILAKVAASLQPENAVVADPALATHVQSTSYVASHHPGSTSLPSFKIVAASTSGVAIVRKLEIRSAANPRMPCRIGSGFVWMDPACGVYANNVGDRSAAGECLVRGPDVRAATVLRDDGGTFVDLTAQAASTAAGDVSFRASPAVNDAIYIGHDEPFFSMLFDRGPGCVNRVGGSLSWEIWTGSTWATISSNTNNIFTSMGSGAGGESGKWGIYTFLPLAAGHQPVAVNGVTKYWTRLRIATPPSTSPTISRIWVSRRIAFGVSAGQLTDSFLQAFGDRAPYLYPASVGTSQSYRAGYGVHTKFDGLIDGSGASFVVLGDMSFEQGRTRDFALFGDGELVNLVDGAGNVRWWGITRPYDDNVPTRGSIPFLVQPAQTVDTKAGSEVVSGSFNAAQLSGRAVVSRFSTAGRAIWGALWGASSVRLHGGSASNPCSFAETVAAARNAVVPMLVNGTLYVRLRLGGDSAKPLHLGWEGASLQFPRVAADGNPLVHVDPGVLGLVIDPLASESVRITGSFLGSVSLWTFEIAATASTLATYNFAQTTLLKADVTLRDVADFVGMSFVDCPRVRQNGATMASCTFDGSLLEASDLGQVSDSSFRSSGSGHAIEITQPGSYTLSGVSFTGYGASGTLDAAIFNNSGGAVTISIAGGGDTPTVRNGAGASTSVVSGATLTLTGLQPGSDIVVLDAGTSTARISVDSHPGSSYAYAYTSTGSVDICIYKPGFRPYVVRAFSLASTDAVLPISQTADPAYSNP